VYNTRIHRGIVNILLYPTRRRARGVQGVRPSNWRLRVSRRICARANEKQYYVLTGNLCFNSRSRARARTPKPRGPLNFTFRDISLFRSAHDGLLSWSYSSEIAVAVKTPDFDVQLKSLLRHSYKSTAQVCVLNLCYYFRPHSLSARLGLCRVSDNVSCASL